jgi:hypothetical protein
LPRGYHASGRESQISTSYRAIPQKMLLDFIVMADKAAAHFTAPYRHDRTTIPKVILMIHGYLKAQLYDVTGRTGLEPI